MLIRNFKRIKYLKFNLTETKIILNKDYFERQDLIEALKIILTNKKTTNDVSIKWTDLDTVYNSKNLKIFYIPSFLDFQKDFLSGNKGLLKNLITEILFSIENTNQTLIEIQNILSNFKLENELDFISKSFQKIEDKHHLTISTFCNNSIASILSENIIFEINDLDMEKIDENNINYSLFKNLYLELLFILTKFLDGQFIVIFDDPFLGMKLNEINFFYEAINKITNKILICSWFPKIKEKELQNVLLIGDKFRLDFSEFYNDINSFQIYIDSAVHDHIDFVLTNILEKYNLFDENLINHINFKNKDEETLFKIFINKF